MTAIAVLCVTIVVSAIAIKIGTVALRMTGLDERTASFQALSMFTGTGFTTHESEKIASHPTRRRIARILMVLGSAGLATVIASSIHSFGGSGGTTATLLKVLAVIVVALTVYRLAVARRLQIVLDRWIERRLRRYTDLSLTEFQEILRLDNQNGIARVEIHEGNPIAGKTLRELALGRNGVLVLAIQRGLGLLATPGATTRIEGGDTLVCYGRPAAVRKVAHGEYEPPPLEGPACHELLTLDNTYGILEVDVDEGSPLANATLEELALPRKRILVLAVQSADGLLPAPSPHRRLAAGERLVCYGPLEGVRGLAGTTREAAAPGRTG